MRGVAAGWGAQGAGLQGYGACVRLRERRASCWGRTAGEAGRLSCRPGRAQGLGGPPQAAARRRPRSAPAGRLHAGSAPLPTSPRALSPTRPPAHPPPPPTPPLPPRYGFIVMDGNGSLFGTLCGNNREILHKARGGGAGGGRWGGGAALGGPSRGRGRVLGWQGGAWRAGVRHRAVPAMAHARTCWRGARCLPALPPTRPRPPSPQVSVDLPKKHGRGGQSALRFARLRMEKRHNYVRKVAELAVQVRWGGGGVQAWMGCAAPLRGAASATPQPPRPTPTRPHPPQTPPPRPPPTVLHHCGPAQRGGPGAGGLRRLQDRAVAVRHV